MLIDFADFLFLPSFIFPQLSSLTSSSSEFPFNRVDFMLTLTFGLDSLFFYSKSLVNVFMCVENEN